MRDLLFDAEAAAATSPEATAQKHMRPVLPKRFYKSVDVAPAEPPASGYLVLLDGRQVKTPAKATLLLPNEASARLVASEWDAQLEKIDPSQMPMTRLANTAIDGIAEDTQAGVQEDQAFIAGRCSVNHDHLLSWLELRTYRQSVSDGVGGIRTLLSGRLRWQAARRSSDEPTPGATTPLRAAHPLIRPPHGLQSKIRSHPPPTVFPWSRPV